MAFSPRFNVFISQDALNRRPSTPEMTTVVSAILEAQGHDPDEHPLQRALRLYLEDVVSRRLDGIRIPVLPPYSKIMLAPPSWAEAGTDWVLPHTERLRQLDRYRKD